jgi:hypothetical protein
MRELESVHIRVSQLLDGHVLGETSIDFHGPRRLRSVSQGADGSTVEVIVWDDDSYFRSSIDGPLFTQRHEETPPSSPAKDLMDRLETARLIQTSPGEFTFTSVEPAEQHRQTTGTVSVNREGLLTRVMVDVDDPLADGQIDQTSYKFDSYNAAAPVSPPSPDQIAAEGEGSTCGNQTLPAGVTVFCGP